MVATVFNLLLQPELSVTIKKANHATLLLRKHGTLIPYLTFYCAPFVHIKILSAYLSRTALRCTCKAVHDDQS